MAKGKTNYPPGGVDTSDATAVAGDILSPKTAYGSAGTKITGTMPSKVGSSTVITPSTSDQTIPQGYYGGAAGDGKVLGDADLVAGNIKKDISIFGVTGTYQGDTTVTTGSVTDGTATIYYSKRGKTYFNLRVADSVRIQGNGWACPLVSDGTTAQRICSLLGETYSSESSNAFYFANTGSANRGKWNGSTWTSDSPQPYPSVTFLSEITVS